MSGANKRHKQPYPETALFALCKYLVSFTYSGVFHFFSTKLAPIQLKCINFVVLVVLHVGKKVDPPMTIECCFFHVFVSS